MASITIRNLPSHVKEALAAQAKARGLSLEAMLRNYLSDQASTKQQSWAEVIDDCLAMAMAAPASSENSFALEPYLPGRTTERPPLVFDQWEDPPEDTLHEPDRGFDR